MSDFVPIRQLHHFAWRCRDAEETRRFYEDLLGLPLTHVVRADNVPSTGDNCPFVHLFFEMRDGSSIAFFDLGDGQVAEPSPNTPKWVNHLALRVDSLAELREARQRLVDAGVEVIGPVDHDGFVQSIYFFDPNGIRLELTMVTASADELAGYKRQARAAVDAWTEEKRSRATLAPAGA
jgi:catechol 2,3-dioxygenase-like lactoylglutathione lyase family enzyme